MSFGRTIGGGLAGLLVGLAAGPVFIAGTVAVLSMMKDAADYETRPGGAEATQAGVVRIAMRGIGHVFDQRCRDACDEISTEGLISDDAKLFDRNGGRVRLSKAGSDR